ncbi:MAG: hypothetical protein KAS66_06350 [Candidatus Omnitrophica bacterium]|nr:hypothetical protein [Candidatus Omnitrophota bacterium]
MAIPIDQAVTSFKALISTVKTDVQTRSWFAFLIQQTALRERLSGEAGVERLYHDLDKIVSGQRILYMLLLFLLGASILSGSYFFIAMSLVTLVVGAHMHLNKKGIVEKICSSLFLKDFKGFFFAKKTLYQIGEFYGQKHRILPLVDMIALSDRISWKAFIMTVFVTYFIYLLNPGYGLFFAIAAFYIIRAIVNTSFVYKHI